MPRIQQYSLYLITHLFLEEILPGDILIDGVTSINGATDITGTLTSSGLITADGGLTVSDGQTLTANGIVNLGDGGDAITLNGSSTTLTGFTNAW